MDNKYNKRYVDNDLYRDFNEVSLDQISSNSYDHELTVYRSVAVLPPQHNEFAGSGYISTQESGYLQKPTLQRDSVKQKPAIIISSSLKSDSKLKAAEIPDILMPTHFIVHQNVDNIASQITKILGDTNGASFHFDESKCEWTVVYLYGSSHVKFQIFIYEKDLDEYVIEGNRLLGDGFSFRNIFSEVKTQLSSASDDTRRYNDISSSVHIPIPVFCEDDVSGDSVLSECFENIFRMAKEPTMEAQLEASRMLCDLTADSAGRQYAVVENGCLVVLKDLIDHSVSEWAKQHAMFALANLSDAKVFELDIVRAGLLPLLLKYATDGPFNTAEMRRSAVHILATLCDGYSSEVAKALGKTSLSTWMTSVDAIKDDKLKMHASRARTQLTKAVEAL